MSIAACEKKSSIKSGFRSDTSTGLERAGNGEPTENTGGSFYCQQRGEPLGACEKRCSALVSAPRSSFAGGRSLDAEGGSGVFPQEPQLESLLRAFRAGSEAEKRRFPEITEESLHIAGVFERIGSALRAAERRSLRKLQGENSQNYQLDIRTGSLQGDGGASPLVACQYKNKSPEAGLPKTYVHACEQNKWTVLTWNRSEPFRITARRFKCRSWRHYGDCLRWKNAQDFARLKQGISSKGEGWVYVVLTVERLPLGTTDALFKSYRSLLSAWDKLRKRLARFYGALSYITLVEQHRDGYPHLNLVIYNAKLHRRASRHWRWVRSRVNTMAIKSGFGLRIWLEPVRSEDAIAGYFVKLTSEIAKLSQVPVSAPSHFRRLRASRGVLPARFKNPDMTGAMSFKSIDEFRSDIESAGALSGEQHEDCVEYVLNKEASRLALAKEVKKTKEEFPERQKFYRNLLDTVLDEPHTDSDNWYYTLRWFRSWIRRLKKIEKFILTRGRPSV